MSGQESNLGADYGPDTPGTTTCGIQEGGTFVISNGGGIVFLMQGKFSVTTPISFTLDIATSQYLRILGSGQGSVVFAASALAAPVLTIQGSSLANSPFNRSAVRDVKFDANGNATEGLYVNYLPGITLEGVLGYNATSHGIDLENSWNSRVVNCQAQSNGGFGLYTAGNNIISIYGGWYAANTTGGVMLSNTQSYIEGTTSQSNTGVGIEATGLSAILKNCWLERNGTYQLYGINLGRLLTQVVLFDVPTGAHGILLGNVSNCILDAVSNNGVDDNIDITFNDITSQYGIHLRNVLMSQMTFNTVPANPAGNMAFASGIVEQNPFAFDLVVLLNVQLSPTSTVAASLEMGSSRTNTVGLFTPANSPAAGPVQNVTVPLHIPSGGWYEIVLTNATLQNAIAYRV
jgi:parallel beta-helix repeat protein